MPGINNGIAHAVLIAGGWISRCGTRNWQGAWADVAGPLEPWLVTVLGLMQRSAAQWTFRVLENWLSFGVGLPKIWPVPEVCGVWYAMGWHQWLSQLFIRITFCSRMLDILDPCGGFLVRRLLDGWSRPTDLTEDPCWAIIIQILWDPVGVHQVC